MEIKTISRIRYCCPYIVRKLWYLGQSDSVFFFTIIKFNSLSHFLFKNFFPSLDCSNLHTLHVFIFVIVIPRVLLSLHGLGHDLHEILFPLLANQDSNLLSFGLVRSQYDCLGILKEVVVIMMDILTVLKLNTKINLN